MPLPPGAWNLWEKVLINIIGLEDQCWKEIILSADPLRGDGGRQEGFGSFWNYQVGASRLREPVD